MYFLTISQFIKMLKNFNGILEKSVAHAEAKKFDMDVLLHARLAPDQFHFIKQIQIMTDTAKLCAARLSGKEAPAHKDDEKSLGEVKARIESVVSYLQSFKESDFADAAKKHISQPRWEGKWLNGEEYLTQHAIPNFYFHMTTAYSILRHNGADVGKKDYLGPMPFKS